ncbi:transcriptional regulator, LacI family [Xanthomonas oryzae pv. oryzae PXO99A]|uniref:Transcriptional regulator, LacI family n=1 Tax=Xanthomonas oryzae pv. oryzae (strain PXO99A) TaxID=360094 RepID=A0A0K0GLC7_XANOP|nr:transcriptional regulator, LacI family [Xanthomonas oryzae pv. oryzae PXO99A]
MAKGAVTIKDVAREAQVSVATVSRALNGHENVAGPVRQQVLEVAERLRYSPHAAARSLSSRRSQTLGVVLPDLYGEFFSELIRGIDGAARAASICWCPAITAIREPRAGRCARCAGASMACWCCRRMRSSRDF